jgi:hypothetical protein
MKPIVLVLLAVSILAINGCKDDSSVNPSQAAGRFVIDSVQLAVNPTRAAFQFVFHFANRPGDCRSFKIDVGNSGMIFAGYPSLGFSPFPVDSLIHLADTLHLFETLAVGDSVRVVYEFRGAFWQKLGSEIVNFGEFTSGDTIRLLVRPQ